MNNGDHTTAQWVISLEVDCPNCYEVIDMYGRVNKKHISPINKEIYYEAGDGVRVKCSCGEEFEVQEILSYD